MNVESYSSVDWFFARLIDSLHSWLILCTVDWFFARLIDSLHGWLILCTVDWFYRLIDWLFNLFDIQVILQKMTKYVILLKVKSNRLVDSQLLIDQVMCCFIDLLIYWLFDQLVDSLIHWLNGTIHIFLFDWSFGLNDLVCLLWMKWLTLWSNNCSGGEDFFL